MVKIADATVLPSTAPQTTQAAVLSSLGALSTQMKYVSVPGQSGTTYHLWLLLQARPEVIRYLVTMDGQESLPALAAREIGMALVPPTCLTPQSPDRLSLPGSRVIELPKFAIRWDPDELRSARRLVASMVGLRLISSKKGQDQIRVLYSFQALAELGTRDFLVTTFPASDLSQPASVLKQRIDAAYWIALARHFNTSRGDDTRESAELLERDGARELEPFLDGFKAIIDGIKVGKVRS
jgi:hypothetical protein